MTCTVNWWEVILNISPIHSLCFMEKRNVAHSYENYKECHGDITDYKGSAGESLGCYLGNLVLALELQCIDMIECWYDVNYQIVGLWYVVCPLEVGIAFLMENVMVQGMLIDE